MATFRRHFIKERLFDCVSQIWGAYRLTELLIKFIQRHLFAGLLRDDRDGFGDGCVLIGLCGNLTAVNIMTDCKELPVPSACR